MRKVKKMDQSPWYLKRSKQKQLNAYSMSLGDCLACKAETGCFLMRNAKKMGKSRKNIRGSERSQNED